MKSAVPLFCQVADLGDIKTFADFQNAIGRADPPLSIAQVPAVDPLALWPLFRYGEKSNELPA